jgi:hypothetical protein
MTPAKFVPGGTIGPAPVAVKPLKRKIEPQMDA